MKKRLITILTVIAVIITFILAKILNYFTISTPLSIIYLIVIFALIEYLLLTITYIVTKLMKKEKIKLKKIIGLVLLFLSLLLILLYMVVLNFDWLTFYIYSSPFYLMVISRSIEFLIPAITLIIISIILLRKK